MKLENHLKLPLISCLCITENRPRLLKRAIDCFYAQTYQNKQLVILYKENDLATSNFISNNSFPNSIKTVKVRNSPRKKLGFVRNISVKSADGEFICIWDDDDWYHMNRLTVQYQVLANSKKQASVLTQYLMYDKCKNKAYMSFKRNFWENSLMCEKRLLLSRKYANKSKGEDTPLVEYLHNTNKLAKIENMANLYIYIYHGDNVCGHDHFERLFSYSKELAELSSIIRKILKGISSSTYNSALLDRFWSEKLEL